MSCVISPPPRRNYADTSELCDSNITAEQRLDGKLADFATHRYFIALNRASISLVLVDFMPLNTARLQLIKSAGRVASLINLNRLFSSTWLSMLASCTTCIFETQAIGPDENLLDGAGDIRLAELVDVVNQQTIEHRPHVTIAPVRVLAG